MGIVYQARHLRLNRVVALKMILAGAHADARDRQRFLAEAQAVAQLQHPNIVQIFEIGEHAGLPFFTLEYIAGGSLAHRLRAQPLEPRAAAALVEQLARGTAFAHEHGIVHRDLKPENVLLAADGTPKIADFGLAKRVDAGEQFTATGTVLGTPSYMAPEQASGQTHAVGPAADVYSLGALLYRALTGRPPFQAATPLDTLAQVVKAEPVPPAQLQPQLPRDLETICLKCLHKVPQRRYGSAAELADDLRRFLAGEPIAARRTSAVERAVKWARRRPAQAAVLAVSAVAALALLGGGLWFTDELRRERDHARRQEADARLARDDAQRQKADADRAWREAAARAQAEILARQAREAMVLDLTTATGLAAGARGDGAQAVLWFAHAARLAGDDPVRAEAERSRAHAWSCLTPRPVHAVVQSDPWLDGVTWHPDGRHLLTHGYDPARDEGQCQLWDLKREQELPLPAAVASAAAWDAAGERLAVGTPTGEVTLWQLPTGEFQPVAWKLACKVAAAGRVTRLLFSPDGRYLAITAGRLVRVWDCAQGAFATPELVHAAPVTTLTFHPAGQQLATACADHSCRVFAVPADNGRPVLPVVGHFQQGFRVVGQKPIPLAFVDEGRGLLTVLNRTITWRNTSTGTVMRTVQMTGLDAKGLLPIDALVVSPDGTMVIALNTMQARVWNVATATGSVRTFPLGHHPNRYITCAAFSPDGKVLATASSDRTVQLWRLADGKPLGGPLTHPTTVDTVSFAPDGRLLTGMRGGQVRIWELPPASAAAYRLQPSAPYSLARLSPDGRHVLASGGSYRSSSLRATKVYEAATGKPAGPSLPAAGFLMDAVLSPDGRHATLAASLAVSPAHRTAQPGQQAGRLTFWDWRDGRQTADPLDLDIEPRMLAYSPDGGRLAVLDAAGVVVLVDAQTHRVVRRWQAHPPQLENNHYRNNGAVCFTPDGQGIVTYGTRADVVNVWDAATGKLRLQLKHRGMCHDVRFSADGKLLATAAFDNTARVWELATGRKLAELDHPDWVMTAVLSPDGKQLLTSCRDGSARLWDWRAGRLAVPPLEHEHEIQAAAFTPDGRRVVTAGDNAVVRVWETGTGKPLTPPLPVGGTGLTLLFTPDGTRAIVAGLMDSVAVVHLADWLTPLPLGPAELCTYGEVLSGQRVHEGGGVTNLTAEEWMERWRALRTAWPGKQTVP
jgi:WD40 repeat protein